MERIHLLWILPVLFLSLSVLQVQAKGGSKIRKPSGNRQTGGPSRPSSGGSDSSTSSSGFSSGIDCGNAENGTDDSCIENLQPHEQIKTPNIWESADINEVKYRFRNATHEERLLTYLFSEYDPCARATMDTSKTVEVQIQFILLRIHGLDERSQVLTTTGLIISDWTDDRLTWDPEKFGNLTDVIVNADKVWLPELALMNGAEELIPDFDRIRLLIRYDGTLHWEPGGIFRTTCDIDITYFPFDTQHCPLIIGAYSYQSERMNITNASDIIETHDFQPNGEWHVFRTSAVWDITVLDCCPGIGYSHVRFTLHMKRRHKFYMMNIILPCLMLSLLIMIGFFLPPDAGEKISLGISVLLAFTVFLLMIADNIPRTSLAIPLMVIYLMATMMLGTISICMTVVVLNVHHRAPRVPVPLWLKTTMLYYLARIVCVRTHYESVRKKEKMYMVKVDQQQHNHQAYHRKGDYNKNGGILDEMETMGLTAVLNNRFHNGPTLTNHIPESSSVCSNLSHASSGSGLKKRHKKLSRSKKSRMFSEEDDSDEDFSRDWHEFAQVLDRIFFWVLLVLMTLSAIFILLYPKYSGAEEREMSSNGS